MSQIEMSHNMHIYWERYSYNIENSMLLHLILSGHHLYVHPSPQQLTLRIFSCSSQETLASSSSALILWTLSSSWCLSSTACRAWALAACRASTSAACSIISRSYLSCASAASFAWEKKNTNKKTICYHTELLKLKHLIALALLFAIGKPDRR